MFVQWSLGQSEGLMVKKLTLGIIATCAFCVIPSTAYPETLSHSQTQKPIPTTVLNGAALQYPGHPIQYGNHNTDVKEIQQRLNELGDNVGSVDGIFGVKTLAEVKHFQKSQGLTVDGIVGPSTWYALFTCQNNGEKLSVTTGVTGDKTVSSTQGDNEETILGPSIINVTGGDNILIQYTVKNDPYANNWGTNPENLDVKSSLLGVSLHDNYKAQRRVVLVWFIRSDGLGTK
jgi:hypothetical protein